MFSIEQVHCRCGRLLNDPSTGWHWLRLRTEPQITGVTTQHPPFRLTRPSPDPPLVPLAMRFLRWRSALLRCTECQGVLAGEDYYPPSPQEPHCGLAQDSSAQESSQACCHKLAPLSAERVYPRQVWCILYCALPRDPRACQHVAPETAPGGADVATAVCGASRDPSAA